MRAAFIAGCPAGALTALLSLLLSGIYAAIIAGLVVGLGGCVFVRFALHWPLWKRR